MYTPRFATSKTTEHPAVHTLEPRSSSHHRPHVYRNLLMGTWICDQEGTRANPGPERARTVYRTHLDAVQAAVDIESAQQLIAA
ncbi:hypothetical protein AB0I53_04315 [Saccharopolyspora sp. NPDC050389]|uniref:hypothetical protein n=1 Tax=Saccharopolyspora sp. NPDC050389 TaxID=3155516 RepID=UPI0033E116F0